MSDSPSPLPRYVPDERFPPYTYVPGRAPHPTSDPRGHSFAQVTSAHEPTSPVDDANWREHRPYLFAVDLFNHGYYWESHEAWEAVWHACGRTGTTADVLKGLIKLAAAGVKLREGRPVGVVRHLRRAIELLSNGRGGEPQRLGLALDPLVAAVTALGEQPPATPDARPEAVRPWLSLQLRLQV
jgi:hypothetical protein